MATISEKRKQEIKSTLNSEFGSLLQQLAANGILTIQRGPLKNTNALIFSYMDRVVHLICPHDGSTKPPFDWQDVFFMKNNSLNWQLHYFKYLSILSEFGIYKLELSPEGRKRINCDSLYSKARNVVQVSLVFNSMARADTAEAAATLKHFECEAAKGYQKQYHDMLDGTRTELDDVKLELRDVRVLLDKTCKDHELEKAALIASHEKDLKNFQKHVYSKNNSDKKKKRKKKKKKSVTQTVTFTPSKTKVSGDVTVNLLNNNSSPSTASSSSSSSSGGSPASTTSP